MYPYFTAVEGMTSSNVSPSQKSAAMVPDTTLEIV